MRPSGDLIGTSGLIYGADRCHFPGVCVQQRRCAPPGGHGLLSVAGIDDSAEWNQSDLNSRNPSFSTNNGSLKDGVSEVDGQGFTRGLGLKSPPDAFAKDPDTGIFRYIESTRGKRKLVGTGNSGRFGYGQGVYVNNFSDRAITADEIGRAQVGASESQAYDWLNPDNGQAGSGWQGPFYVPRGSYVELVNDGFYISPDNQGAKCGTVLERTWQGERAHRPFRRRGAIGHDSLSHRTRRRRSASHRKHLHARSGKSRACDRHSPFDFDSATYDDGPVFDGVLYFEGNVRVRGVIPVDVQLTLVSNATSFCGREHHQGRDKPGWNAAQPANEVDDDADSARLVTINTTQFFGTSVNQALEAVNDTQNAIAYNPVRMRVGGQTLNFVNELPLDSLGPGAILADPTTWRPYALDYKDPTDSSSASRITSKLLLTHTMDDGPAPSTFISMDVNYGTNSRPCSRPRATTGCTGSSFRITTRLRSLISIKFPALTSADYEPIYGLGVEPWQRYSRFESVAFPLVESDFVYDTANNYVIEGKRPAAANSPDPEGDYVMFTNASNQFQISHNNVGTDPTNDYLLARAAMVPADIKIKASMYAETGSFFVIPGPPYNPNPNDRRDVFEQAVTNDGGLGSVGPSSKLSRKGLKIMAPSRETPFYGEPLDVRINIIGSISGNMPAPIDQQAQWIKRWGWIPAQEGCVYDFTGASPRPVLIPSSHVPSRPDGTPYNIDPASANSDLYVPNLILAVVLLWLRRG